MSTINCVSFRGHGTESTGSIAHKNQPTQCPTCGDQVCFKGSNKKEKGPSAGGVILTVAALTAAVIGGLGYAHKAEAFTKLKDGWMKKTIGKLEPAAKTCHEWCSTAKTKATDTWTKIKSKFSKKS